MAAASRSGGARAAMPMTLQPSPRNSLAGALF
jgi:hypothetical protein